MFTLFNRQKFRCRTTTRRDSQRRLAIEPLEARAMMAGDLIPVVENGVPVEVLHDRVDSLLIEQTAINGEFDHVVTGDFNGDGRDDLMFHARHSGNNRWFFARPDASFDYLGTQIELTAVNGEFDHVATGDFNGDGFDDVVFHAKHSGNNRFFYSRGDGSFDYMGTLIATTAVNGEFDNLVVGDFDGNGVDDLLFHAIASGNNRWFFSRGDGTFDFQHNPIDYRGVNGEFDNVVAGDFNGDGRDDVLFHASVSGNNRWSYRRPDGTLESLVINPLAPTAANTVFENVVATDVNRDGRDDVVFHDYESGYNRWFHSQGNHQFLKLYDNPIQLAAVNTVFNHLVAGDFNGDGAGDLLFHAHPSGYNRFAYSHTSHLPDLDGISIDWDPNHNRLLINGSEERDSITVSVEGGVVNVNGAINVGSAERTESIDINGHDGNDTLRNISDVRAILRGEDGDDTLVGGAGDEFFGGTGVDRFFVDGAEEVIISPNITPGDPSNVGVNVVRIVAADGSLCSGTMITPQHVLTAAHCVDTRMAGGALRSDQIPDHGHQGYTIRIGADAVDFDLDVKSDRVDIHPDYVFEGKAVNGEIVADKLAHDVAVVTLAKPVTQFAGGLPSAENYVGQNLYAGPLNSTDEAIIMGYASSNVRRAGEIEIDVVAPSKIAWQQDNPGEAKIEGGDSGGPMFIPVRGGDYKLAGIHSTHNGTTSTDMRVAFYRNWIVTAVGFSGDSTGPRARLLDGARIAPGVARVQVEYSDASGVKQAGLFVVTKNSLTIRRRAMLVDLDNTDDTRVIATYEFPLSSLGTYELNFEAIDNAGNQSSGTLHRFEWSTITLGADRTHLDGNRHARVAKGDAELNTDDNTGVFVRYSLRIENGKRIMLNLRMDAYELHSDRRFQDTHIVTERSDIEVFRLQDGDPRYIKSLNHGGWAAYHILRGKLHHWIPFNGGRVGRLWDLQVHVDAKGGNDLPQQQLRANFDFNLGDVEFGQRSAVTANGADESVANDEDALDGDSSGGDGTLETSSITSLHSSHVDLENKSADGAVTIHGTFFDLDQTNAHQVKVDWGDGSPAENIEVDQLADTFAASHIYKGGGIYQVKVALEDDSRKIATATTKSVVDDAIADDDDQLDPSQSDSIGVRRANFVFQDTTGDGGWNVGDSIFRFGIPGDTPITGDWDGDGFDEIGVHRGNYFFLDLSGDGAWSAGDVAYRFGNVGDTPIIGDWDGDGADNIGVHRKNFFFLDATGDGAWNRGDLIQRFGIVGDTPITGDWDGDGTDNIGIHRGNFFFLDASANGAWSAGDVVYRFGNPGDMPLIGDWDGDGKDNIGLQRGRTFFLDNDGDGRWSKNDRSYAFGTDTDTGIAGRWREAQPIMAAAGEANDPDISAKTLASEQLAPIVSAAVDILAAEGLSDAQVKALEKIHIRIADLDGALLGHALGNSITIDGNAAGHGWFVDVTPEANEDFELATNGNLVAMGESAAYGHVDLLSVLLHEMGHILDLDDDYSHASSNKVMNGWLEEGIRRLPTEGEIAPPTILQTMESYSIV